MNFFKPFAKSGALAIAVFLVSCTVVVEEGTELRPPPRPGPQFCTREYAPVCARRGERRRTFPNACIAEAEGYRPIHAGECRVEPPQFCTREYAPVCARRGGQSRTFSNACLAQAAGYRPVHGGECLSIRPPQPQFCTREYAPVCARRGSRVRTFGNACEARAASYLILRPGEC